MDMRSFFFFFLVPQRKTGYLKKAEVGAECSKGMIGTLRLTCGPKYTSLNEHIRQFNMKASAR